MEVRTEEERTPNHDGGKHTEPNETTPLTEPEYVMPPQQSPTSLATCPPCPCGLPTRSSGPSAAGWDSWLRNAGPHSLPGEKAFLVLLGWLWVPLKGFLHKWDP